MRQHSSCAKIPRQSLGVPRGTEILVEPVRLAELGALLLLIPQRRR